jgi:hypothetical protein
MSSETADLVLRRFPDSWEARIPESVRAKMAVEIPPLTQKVVGLKVALSAQAKGAQSLKVHFVQRQSATQQIVGGVAVRLNMGMRTWEVLGNSLPARKRFRKQVRKRRTPLRRLLLEGSIGQLAWTSGW